MIETQIAVSLYEQDYLLWIEDIVHKLQTRDIKGLDFDNLIEEIESLGRSQKHELENRLGELFEHILKRTYVNMPDCYRGWVESIDKQRVSIKRLLKQAPSLKPYFNQVFDEVYEDTLKIVRRSYPHCEFPDTWPFSCDIDAMLNVDFWEE
jgi:DNA-directed RNA polymerase delta subunit